MQTITQRNFLAQQVSDKWGAQPIGDVWHVDLVELCLSIQHRELSSNLVPSLQRVSSSHALHPELNTVQAMTLRKEVHTRGSTIDLVLIVSTLQLEKYNLSFLNIFQMCSLWLGLVPGSIAPKLRMSVTVFQ